MNRAVAFLDWGRWVADCPSPLCTNALEVRPGQGTWRCGGGQIPGCGVTAPLGWPADPAAITAAVAGLPEAQRHWHPRDDEETE